MRGARKTTRDWIGLEKQLKLDELCRAMIVHDVAVPSYVAREIKQDINDF